MIKKKLKVGSLIIHEHSAYEPTIGACSRYAIVSKMEGTKIWHIHLNYSECKDGITNFHAFTIKDEDILSLVQGVLLLSPKELKNYRLLQQIIKNLKKREVKKHDRI